MLSSGGERLTPKVLDHYLHHDLGMLPLLWCFVAHLLILEYPDHHQNLISSSLYYPGQLHDISSQFVHKNQDGPIYAEMKVADIDIIFQIDCGATVNIVPKDKIRSVKLS